MFVDGPFVFVGKGNDLIQEGLVPRLGYILVYGGEQPQGIVGAVGRVAGLRHIGGIVGGVLMAGIVGEFHQGQTAAVVHLGGEHEPDLLLGHGRFQMDDALDVLHGVPVAVAVAQAAVDQRSRPAPHKGDEAVVGVPGVDHRIEGVVGGVDLQMV